MNIIWRIKRLNTNNQRLLLIISLLYWSLFTAIYFLPALNKLKSRMNIYSIYDNCIIIATIIFAFYTTTYFTVFTGSIGSKLKLSFSFSNNPKIDNLAYVTNYFRLGCFSVFVLISSILLSQIFNLDYYFIQIFIGYIFIISGCFFYWIFNSITNIVGIINNKN